MEKSDNREIFSRGGGGPKWEMESSFATNPLIDEVDGWNLADL
jgi:hypothetical protein